MDISRWVEQQVGVRLLRLHDAIYRGTHGRIGHRIPGAPPSLLLHTVGAKTALPRTNALSYARDGEGYVIVASKGGDPQAPGWYHNLKANPNVEINLGPQRFPVTAKSYLPQDAEYAKLWQLVNDNNAHRYDAYQRRTSRPIPVIVLTRR